MVCASQNYNYNIYLKITVPLGKERPNFPTNWLKRINKGLI